MKKLHIHLRSEGIKYHKDVLQLISKTLKSKFVRLNKKNTPFKSVRGKMTLSNRGFNISLPQLDFLSDIQIGKTYKGIELSSKVIPNIIIDDLYINRLGSKGCNGQIGRFHSKGYSAKKKYYYKAIIPVSTRFNFYETLEQIHFTNDFEVSSVNATRVLIRSEEIEIFSIDNNAKEYFILIESNTKQTYNDFSEKIFAIKIGLAYINTKYLGDHCFYVSYTKKEKAIPSHFLYQEQRPTNTSTYYPININPKTFSVSFKNKLRKLSIIEFSKLVECMLDSVDFRSVLLLIIESNKASLLLRPGAYAIALESLSDIIIDKNKKEKNQLPIRNYAKKLLMNV